MKTMAEVITSHATHGLRDGKHVCHAPGCLWVYGRHGYPSPATVAEHVADALSAAGFGPVREAAAAGVRSIYDIWGAGGRRTVRMGEIHDADKTILSGEWDNHIKWNMADIAKERARAAAITESTTK